MHLFWQENEKWYTSVLWPNHLRPLCCLIDMKKDKRLWHIKSVKPQRATSIQSSAPYSLTPSSHHQKWGTEYKIHHLCILLEDLLSFQKGQSEVEIDNLCQCWTVHQMFWELCVKTQCGPIRASQLSHRTRHLFQVSLLASLHSWNRVKPMLIRKRNFLCDYGSLRSSPIDHRWWKSPSFHQTSLCPELGIMCTEWYLIYCE